LVRESAQEQKILVVGASEAQPRFEGVNLEECSAAFLSSCGEPLFVGGGVSGTHRAGGVVALVQGLGIGGLRNLRLRVAVPDGILGRK